MRIEADSTKTAPAEIRIRLRVEAKSAIRNLRARA